jgi:NADH dehydrogenase
MSAEPNPTVIMGGGFVGLLTVLQLSQQDYPYPIVLIEPRDRFVFKPLLYELLTDELHVEQICPFYRELLADRGVQFVQDTVQAVDLHQRQIFLDSGQSLTYHNLVLALGSQTIYLNTSGAADYAFPFTSADEAIALKQHLKQCLEKARQAHDPEDRSQLLTVAVIGAGPAGVELACTLADVLPVWYDELGGNYEDLRVVLMNRSDGILKGDINSRLRKTAQRALRERTIPVDFLPNVAISSVGLNGVTYDRHEKTEFLPAATLIWTAGTAPHPLLMSLPIAPEQRDRRGRLQVLPTLQLPDFPEVFVGGDCASVPDAPQPATAQVAYQQGKAIAHNLLAIAQGRSPSPAHVALRGTLMKLGIGEGVANLFDRVEVKGEIGHLIREATYLELLPTPARNARLTTEWLKDELFQQHQPRSLHPNRYARTPFLAGAAATAAGLLISMPLIWRAAQPQQFQHSFQWTGIPTLFDRLAPQSTLQ